MLLSRSFRFLIIGCLLLVNHSLFALGSQLSFTHLDISDGLLHNQVNCIMKDAKGFIWMGTPSGLSRYDGKRFINFRHNPLDSSSLAENYIEQIYPLPGGKLWIEARGKVDIFDTRTLQFNHLEQSYLGSLGLPKGQVIRIRQLDQHSYVFVYKDKGIAHYQLPSFLNPLPKINFFPGIPGLQLSDAAMDRQNNLWAISRKGELSYYDHKKGQWSHKASLEQNQSKAKTLDAYRIFIDSRSTLWLYSAGLPGPLIHYLPVTETLKSYRAGKIIPGSEAQPRLNNNIINAIAEDGQGQIWVGTDHGGINIIQPQNSSVRYLMNNPENQKSLAQNCIYDLYKDGSGMIWVGTYKKGVCYYNEKADRFPLYSHDPNSINSNNTLPFEDVNRFVEDEKGNLWIGTNGGGLIYFNRKKGQFERYTHNSTDPASLCSDVIVGLCYDSHHRLWIGTYYGGLDCYENGKFTHYRHDPANPQSLSDDRVWDITEDASGNIWVGTLGGGLQMLNPSTGLFKDYAPSDPNIEGVEFILTMTRLKNGDLWVGTAAGIDIYPKNGGRTRHLSNNPKNQQSISNDNINAIYEDKKGQVWVGTREGLNCIDLQTNQIRRFTIQDGLPDNTILTILEDNFGYLWMSTPSGLIRFNPPKTFKDPVAGASFRKFDEYDGLQGREFNEKSGYKTHFGELIFGGAGGFNIFNPDSISIDYQTPPIVFTELQIGGSATKIGKSYSGKVILNQAISWTDHLRLPHGASDFSLSFMALGYGHSPRIKYAYRLKGFNDNWIPIESNADYSATYTNLNAGDYTLEVRSCNQDGIWNKTPATMELSILPPFWKSSVAYFIYALLLGGLLYLARTILLYRAGLKFQLEKERQQASHTHDMDMLKIRFLTNISHELRTPLSLIIAPLEKLLKEVRESGQKNQLDMIHRNAKRLLHLVGQLLDFRKMEVQEIHLHSTSSNIIDFIKDRAISFTDIAEKKNINFTISSSIPNLEAQFDPDKLERILFNLLSNAFKFTPERGQIHLDMQQVWEQEKPWLKILIEDDGIGIPEDKLHQIFERFFQHEHPYQTVNAGSGIGLSITQEFVRLHGGRIQVSSEQGKGSRFNIYLPVEGHKAQPLLHEPIKQVNTKPKHKFSIEALKSVVQPETDEATPHLNGHKKTILIVEDHEDFRFYLKDNLSVQFNILEAREGEEGWALTLEHKPDLIVSDIMMEGMDGLQLCRKIKKDPRTAAIPVILLTARASEAQTVEGLNQGANDYMTKPFNFEILQARIINLLQQVKQLKKDSPAKIDLQPEAPQMDSQQEQFLQAAVQAVEASMEDPDFSVEQLSQAVFVSRVTLYKKLVEITGKTPIQFIRTLRVKKAAVYLKKGLSVSQAAFEVGYNNPKIFTKHFKELFGMLPSEYSKEQKIKTLLTSDEL